MAVIRLDLVILIMPHDAFGALFSAGRLAWRCNEGDWHFNRRLIAKLAARDQLKIFRCSPSAMSPISIGANVTDARPGIVAAAIRHLFLVVREEPKAPQIPLVFHHIMALAGLLNFAGSHFQR